MAAKKPPVTKTLRAAPTSSPALSQWITGAPAVDSAIQRPDSLTAQRSDDLTTQRSDDSALQAARSMVQRRSGERRQVTYYIGPRRATELKVHAAERHTTMMAIIAQLIEGWLDAPERYELPQGDALHEDQHMERGPSLVERADGSTRYRISAYLDPQQATRFKVAALRRGPEMSAIVDALIAHHLAAS